MAIRMKYVLILFAIIFSIPFLIKAQTIEVGIKEIINIEIGPISYNKTIINSPLIISFDVYNTGSVGYRARARVEIYSGKNVIYRGWSKEYSLQPGVTNNLKVYWFPSNITGNFKAKIRVYYANEIKDLSPIEFTIKNQITPKKSIEITNFKTFDKNIIFGISSDEDIDNLLIMPSNYPLGWFFEQKYIEKLKKNEKMVMEVNYEPTLWKPSEVSLTIASVDGKYYTIESFKMNREGRFSQFLYDMIKILQDIIR
jgi:hypothetical protein